MTRTRFRNSTTLAALVLAAANVAHAQSAGPSPWPQNPPVQSSSQSPWPGSPPAAAAPSQSPFDRAPNAAPAAQSPFDRPAPQGNVSVSPFDGAAQQQQPPCMNELMPMRQEADKRGKAIQEAAAHKVTPQEACTLFNAFIAANSKFVKFVTQNASRCGIPAQIIAQVKHEQDGAAQMRTKVCMAAKAQQQAGGLGPSLGEALGTSQVPDAKNVRSGRGTFDTLTGTPLGNAK